MLGTVVVLVAGNVAVFVTDLNLLCQYLVVRLGGVVFFHLDRLLFPGIVLVLGCGIPLGFLYPPDLSQEMGIRSHGQYVVVRVCAGLGLVGLGCGSISLYDTQMIDAPCYDGRSTHPGRRSGNLPLARMS